MIPDNPQVWLYLIVAAAVVIGLAVLLGRGLKIRTKAGSVEVSARSKPAERDSSVSVANRLDLQESEVEGIVGRSGGEAGAEPPGRENIDVLRDSKVKKSKIGKIVGREG